MHIQQKPSEHHGERNTKKQKNAYLCDFFLKKSFSSFLCPCLEKIQCFFPSLDRPEVWEVQSFEGAKDFPPRHFSLGMVCQHNLFFLLNVAGDTCSDQNVPEMWATTCERFMLATNGKA
jgi:hypothetical protein